MVEFALDRSPLIYEKSVLRPPSSVFRPPSSCNPQPATCYAILAKYFDQIGGCYLFDCS